MKPIVKTLLTCWPFLIAAVLAGSPAVDDRWDLESRLIVSGEDWRVVIDGESETILLERKGDEVADMIAFSFYGSEKMAIESARVTDAGDSGGRVVEMVFAVAEAKSDGRLVIGEEGGIEIHPSPEIASVRISGDIRLGLLPGISLEDLCYQPGRMEEGEVLHVPSERVVAGMVGEGSGMFAAAWEPAGQRVTLSRVPGETEPVVPWEITPEGRPLRVMLSVGEGIWTRVDIELTANGTRDVRLEWNRPFPGNWRTSIVYRDIVSDLSISPDKLGTWRGAFYPFWFDKENGTHLRTGGPFQLREEGVIAYLFDEDPRSLMAMLRASSSGDYFEGLLKKEPPYPGSGAAPGVGFTACWGTDLLRASLLAVGAHRRETAYLDEWIDSVTLHYVVGTQNRRTEHHDLILDLDRRIGEWIEQEGDEDTLEFLRAMQAEAGTMFDLYAALIQRDGESGPDEYVCHVRELGDRMRDLIRTPGMEFAVETDFIVNRMNHVTWAHQEHTGGRTGGGVGHHWRHWFQEAGRLGSKNPRSVEYAETIRDAIREHLRKRFFETMTY